MHTLNSLNKEPNKVNILQMIDVSFNLYISLLPLPPLPLPCIFWLLLKKLISVAQSCLTRCDPMNCSTPGLPVLHQPQSLLKLMAIESVMPSDHLILCHPLLLPPSIFPSIRVFSNESVLRIRWPKHWSFSFNINPSNDYSGLISFRMDWLDLLAVQGTLKSPTVQKHQFFSAQLSL